MHLPKVIKDLIMDYHKDFETTEKYDKVVEQLEHSCKWIQCSGRSESMLTLALTFRYYPSTKIHSLTNGSSISIAGFTPPPESWSYLEELQRHGISPDDPRL